MDSVRLVLELLNSMWNLKHVSPFCPQGSGKESIHGNKIISVQCGLNIPLFSPTIKANVKHYKMKIRNSSDIAFGFADLLLSSKSMQITETQKVFKILLTYS